MSDFFGSLFISIFVVFGMLIMLGFINELFGSLVLALTLLFSPIIIFKILTKQEKIDNENKFLELNLMEIKEYEFEVQNLIKITCNGKNKDEARQNLLNNFRYAIEELLCEDFDVSEGTEI